jgi:excisionase family DNA binding protein
MTAFLSTREVSKLTGWHVAKVRRLIESGKLPAIDTSAGGRPRWAVLRSDLDQFLTPVRQEVTHDVVTR